tara:strand:- start:143 stop:355 length:213 start_codon:yes stop_codon:yes gene_type:complete
MSDNTVTIDSKVYDLDKLSDDATLACSLLQEVQGEIVKVSRKLDIFRSSAVALTNKVRELVDEDAIVKDK